MAKKQQKFKVHGLTIDDALDLGGILASGGLTGQASQALAQISETNNRGPAMQAVTSLVMGAIANRNTRDDMRGFLFSIWKTTEDEQATAKDLEFGRLKVRYDDEGELDEDSLYYRKLVRFHALPPSALIGLVKAVYESDGFEDFLELLRAELPTITTSQQTESNGSTTSAA